MPPTALGSRLRLLRKRRQLTLAQVGELVGVSLGVVNHWEQGRTQVPSELVPAISQALKVPICDFYGVPEGHQVPATLTLAEQLAQALGVEPARVEVNVYGSAGEFMPTRADYDTRAALRAWEAMPESVRQEWLEFADRLREEKGDEPHG